MRASNLRHDRVLEANVLAEGNTQEHGQYDMSIVEPEVRTITLMLDAILIECGMMRSCHLTERSSSLCQPVSERNQPLSSWFIRA